MEERVSRLETEVINLDKRLCANERRLDIHGEEIDGINKVVGTLEKNMALLNLTVDTVLDNTKEIKGDIKEIRKLREDESNYFYHTLQEIRTSRRTEEEKVVPVDQQGLCFR